MRLWRPYRRGMEPGDAGEVVIPYVCGCWRHPGPCAVKASQRNYARLLFALNQRPIEIVTFGVLTLDKRGRKHGLKNAYRGLESRWRLLKQKITRTFGKFEYCTTIEAHADDYPHMNVVLLVPELAELAPAPHLAEDCPDRRWSERRGRWDHGCPNAAQRWLKDTAASVGWGPLATLQRALEREALASYVTKIGHGLVREPSGLGGEVTKLAQVPLAAPPRTRILRPSQYFLPPKDPPQWTGELVRRPLPTTEAARQAVKVAERAEAIGFDPFTGEVADAGHADRVRESLEHVFDGTGVHTGKRWT